MAQEDSLTCDDIWPCDASDCSWSYYLASVASIAELTDGGSDEVSIGVLEEC